MSISRFLFERFSLENGVTMTVAPMNTRNVAIVVFVKNGSQYERANESGISHFVEHYLFRGTKQLSDFRAIEEFLEDLRAQPSAHTDYEEVCYSVRVPKRHFMGSLKVFDILIAPVFREEELSKEKEIIFQEMGTRLDKPSDCVQSDLWAQTCFGDQPAGRPVIGSEKTVTGFTAKQLENYFKRHYVGEAIKVAVAGGDNLHNFIPELKEIFGKIKCGHARKPFPIVDSQKFPRCLISCKDTALTHLYLGVKTPFRSADNGGYAAILLARIISRNLYLSMIGDKGLSYERYTDYLEDTTKSYLSTYAGVTHARFTETIRLILAEYRKIRDFGVTHRELNNEIESMVEDLEEHFEDEPGIVANFFGRDDLHIGVIHSPEEEFRRIKAVNRDDIKRTAELIFRLQNLNLAVLGPHENSKDLLNILKGGF